MTTDIAIVMLDRYTDKYLDGLWAEYVQDTIKKSKSESLQLLDKYTELSLQNIWAEYVSASIKKNKLESQKSFNFFV
jgi:hypothetical protein